MPYSRRGNRQAASQACLRDIHTHIYTHTHTHISTHMHTAQLPCMTWGKWEHNYQIAMTFAPLPFVLEVPSPLIDCSGYWSYSSQPVIKGKSGLCTGHFCSPLSLPHLSPSLLSVMFQINCQNKFFFKSLEK